ncbi:uncharacterized protein LOC130713398 [Lotus japonicus]|uniref:uncharacterized protein LOC130713398 n=1 Tax=Lotus japonicus TaxID=34305 RepID=UPI00259111E3|nr:uncharacterized protein LOC130713398 [Lotus japonicus]
MEMGYWVENRWVWDLKWKERISGEDTLKLGVMKQIISSYSLIKGKKDTWVWTLEGDGHYSVKSAYDLISGLDTTAGVTIFSKLWKACAPSNAVALGWRVLLNRLQTKENLARRNIPIGNLSCPWCGSETESTSHLLFTCGFAWKVWTLLLRWLNLVLVLPDEPSYHFAQFVESCSLLKRNALSAVWLASVGMLWNGRNSVIFREETVDTNDLSERIKLKSWNWLRARQHEFQYSFFEWCNDPLLCLP